MNHHIYDIINWDPINTNSFNLLAKIEIKADVKLLELFNKAPLFNVLCQIIDTENYGNKVIYGTIDRSLNDDTKYYITLDHVWLGYPVKNGKIQFFPNTVNKTIEYVNSKINDPIIVPNTNTEVISNNLSVPALTTELTTEKVKIKITDLIYPVLISLSIIVLIQSFRM